MIENKFTKEYDRLDLFAKNTVEGFITGLHKSPYHGFSVEFAEHKVYNQGTSTRHIDWKLFARTDKLFVKRYEEETNLRCQIVIDVSSSMYFPIQKKTSLLKPNKLIFSICCAASLMNLLKRQRDAVGLTLFSEKIEFHSVPKTTSKHHAILLNQLEEKIKSFSQNKKTFTVKSLHEIAENIHRRSLIILFTDMIDNSNNSEELFSALQHLKFNKHEVIIFNVQDYSKEVNFDYDNSPYKFIDLENKNEIRLFSDEVRKNYVAKQKDFLNKLKLKCMQYKIDLIDADINKGYNNILSSYLLKRSKLY